MKELVIGELPVVPHCEWQLEYVPEMWVKDGRNKMRSIEGYCLSLLKDGEVLDSVDLYNMHGKIIATEARRMLERRARERKEQMVKEGPVRLVPGVTVCVR